MAFFFFSSLFFSIKRLFRYLRFLQQDAYLPGRFLKWYWKEQAYDKRGTAVVALSAALPFKWSVEIGALFLLFIALIEENPFKKGKLKLKLTPRAKRIAAVACILYFLLQSLVFAYRHFLAQVLIFQVLPFLLLASLFLLSRDESKRQKQFMEEAKKQLEKVSPFVIGITGSYGKTSTKNALGQILQITLGPSYWPPKGINTDMGITRSIREDLKPCTQFAVIEMAAYGQGSISRLCRLTPPKAGIITGVGLAHLDRFGSKEAIYHTKAELARAVPKEGILVCNGDNSGAREIAAAFKKETTLLYGLDNSKQDLDCWIKSFKTAEKGTHFEIVWKGGLLEGVCALHGETALSNCAAAFTMVCALGAQPAYALAAISTLTPVANRLQVLRSDGKIYIRDAYNSNPEGFLSALNVLKNISANKKILMTPGMIELAGQSSEIHRKIGSCSANICDLAILVGKTNRQSMTLGLLDGGFKKEQIITADYRSEAFEKLAAVLDKGDAVLIENDLPDLYEYKGSF